MIRRHSLADISSLAADSYPFDSLGYPHSTYYDTNNAATIYTLRRASSPVMLPTARTTVTAPGAAAAMPELDDQPDQPKSAKKKNKKKAKKKANSRNNNKGEGNSVAQGGVDGVEGNVNNNNNASMPLIVNGASLKHRIDQMSGISTEVCLLTMSTVYMVVSSN